MSNRFRSPRSQHGDVTNGLISIAKSGGERGLKRRVSETKSQPFSLGGYDAVRKEEYVCHLAERKT